MSKNPDSALEGDACAGNFGAVTNAELGPNQRYTLHDLSRRHDVFSLRPQLLAVSIDWVTQRSNAAPVGEVLVRAELEWATGKARQRAVVDVPAQGTIVVLPAGDGLQVDVVREGSSNLQAIAVRSTVGIATGPSARAQRTVSTGALPIIGGPLAIPRWARAVRMYVDAGTLVGDSIRFFSDRASPAIVTADAPDSQSLTIPAGALFWDVVLTPSIGRVVRTVWELAI